MPVATGRSGVLTRNSRRQLVMRLDRFHVRGFRSLADVRDIPLRSPTILTGQNDGGKSATLAALGFLLNGQVPALEDHTFEWGTHLDFPQGLALAAWPRSRALSR